MQLQSSPATLPTAWRTPLGRLVAVVGHELRNPLGAAVAGLSAAAEMTEAQDPRSPFLRRALSDLARVSDLLTRYLEFVRSGSPRPERVELGALAERLAARYPGKLRLDTRAAGLVVRGDAGLLERCLENLIDNAIEAGATEVHLTIARESDGTVLNVADNGPGIATDVRGRVFDPFVSGRGSNGVGLALVADVIQSHGGTIAVAPSEAGTCFRISLP